MREPVRLRRGPLCGYPMLLTLSCLVLLVAGCPGGSGECGDGVCDTDEACFEDCGTFWTCGDGVCHDEYEGCIKSDYCLEDCGICCGDGLCGDGEDATSCPGDCGPDACGNGVCDPWDECIEDCGFFWSCPDGVCHDKYEGCGKSDYCVEDCGICCGDGLCGDGEDGTNCPQDCPPETFGLHEELAGPTDLVSSHLVFTPGGALYTVSSSCVMALPFAPGSGDNSYTLALMDDDDEQLVTFPFGIFDFAQTGQLDVYVNANGHAAFQPTGAPLFSVADFYAEGRIGAVFADLTGGSIIVDEVTSAPTGAVVLTWTGWSTAGNGTALGDFQLLLLEGGSFEIAYAGAMPDDGMIAGFARSLVNPGIGLATDLVATACP